MENQTIGDRMRLAREAAQLNQSAAARLLGCARQAVWLWETGRTQPEAQSLARIREIYGADLNWLVCGKTLDASAWGRTARRILQEAENKAMPTPFRKIKTLGKR